MLKKVENKWIIKVGSKYVGDHGWLVPTQADAHIWYYKKDAKLASLLYGLGSDGSTYAVTVMALELK